MAAWLSSTGTSHHDLLPPIPSTCLLAVNSSPCSGTAPQSPNSSSQLLWTSVPAPGMYGCSKDCLILIPFRLLQISSFTLNLKCFCSDSGNCPDVGIGPLLQFPHLLRAGPLLTTLLFCPLVPSSYGVLHGSIFFPTGQVLLSTLSWYSACTSVSEGVSLMYPWREMYYIHLLL